MKQLKIWMSFMCLFALLFTSCSKENESLQNSPEKATLSFEALLNDLTRQSDNKAHIPECSDAMPAYVEIILANEAGENVVGSTATPFRVNLATSQDFTEEVPELRLDPGEYSLEHFVVYDQDGNMIWIAPRDGEMATYIQNALPMSIDLGAGVKKYVQVDVLCFDDRNVNEYGYLFFELNENEAIEFCIFGNVCDETGRHAVAEYEVDVWYGTSDSGTILYSNLGNSITTNQDGDESSAPVCVALPDTEGEDSYYFEISMDGELIRSGTITDNDVRGLFDGDSNTEFFHFREGNCNLNDSPDLFDEGDGEQNTSEFTVTITNVVTPKPIFQSGVFKIPEGASGQGPLLPGDSYEFDIHAGPVVLPMDGGTRLSFVTMFVQSNDLFFAPNEGGIPLYDGSDNPIGASGPVDVTDQVNIYDAGTEVNGATGGPNQKPQQAPTAEDQGINENGVVRLITNNMDSFGNVIPDAEEVIKVTIENIGDAQFRVRIKNVSTATTIATPALGEGTRAAVPISPGVYAVHTRPAPFFVVGQAAAFAGLVTSEEGVENIAEDGFPAALAADTFAATGLIVPLSPGAWAVHETGATPIFEFNTSDYAEGLEAIAEDGKPAGVLANSLSALASVRIADLFNTPVGASAPGPIGPEQSYKFTFTASEGESLSFATMFIQSNDWFYSFDETGIQLFENGAAISGDVTSNISLYDLGTEIDEFPGAGLFQVIRQPALNTGPNDDSDIVTLVNPANHENVQPASQVIMVTIESNN